MLLSGTYKLQPNRPVDIPEEKGHVDSSSTMANIPQQPQVDPNCKEAMEDDCCGLIRIIGSRYSSSILGLLDRTFNDWVETGLAEPAPGTVRIDDCLGD